MFQRAAYPVFPGLPPPPAIYEKVIKKLQYELDAEAEAEAEAAIEEEYDEWFNTLFSFAFAISFLYHIQYLFSSCSFSSPSDQVLYWVFKEINSF